MDKIKRISLLVLLTAFSPSLMADEGMWIPLLIEKHNIKIMQEKGFRLSAGDIYSVNKACMKDAVLHFGGKCTGELISSEGLLITNHHCGYDEIQKHSSLEHDYLTNGFWAMSKKEELPNPELTVTFLRYMEDVTEKVLKGVKDEMPASERERSIAANIKEIREAATRGNSYSAAVSPFYMGNQYFLFVNEIFRDIRLVGAPPSAIGKFGGETDNWIWPRHTGDFSLFRIYADMNNKPADYSDENVPYKPVYYFPVSLRGVREGDFTMVFGYPGATSQYVPSYHIEMVKDYVNPKMISIRTEKIRIMEEAMASDPLIRIQYSAKKSGIANSWKKWIGELQGLDRMNTVEKKKEYEERFMRWAEEDGERNLKYGSILDDYKELYSRFKDYTLAGSYSNEILNGAEVFTMARAAGVIADMYTEGRSEKEIEAAKERLEVWAKDFFRDYNSSTDKKLFTVLMKMYGENLDQKWFAPEYIKIRASCRGDFQSLADRVWDKSVLTNEGRFLSFIKGFTGTSARKLEKDPLYLLGTGAAGFILKQIRPELLRLTSEVQLLNRKYMAAMMEYEEGRVFYPDANSTLRIAYGEVKGYKPKDGVFFNYYTTLTGIMEKDNPEVYDYDVPGRLKELYLKGDFGRYGRDGEVPVCFIANNHTTGGNSGSPVINAEGHLIGINFDRAWEGVASDMAFNPDQSRNISLDIRYVLFIIDKFAGAGYLLNEMKIIE